MMKIYMKRGICGFFIGATTSYLLVILEALNAEAATFDGNLLFVHFILTALLGFHLAGSSAVFNQEEWSLLKQTMVHFVCMLPAIVVAYYLGWMPSTALGSITYIIAFLLIYIAQWILSFLYWKNQAKDIREHLVKFQKNKIGIEGSYEV